MILTAQGLTDGVCTGELALLSESLSLWGGFDLGTGRIMDATHPQHGKLLTSRILAMRTARGSSSSSSALVEAVRSGTAPAAILLTIADPILVIGSLVAWELYQKRLPILIVRESDWLHLTDGDTAKVESLDGAGRITMEEASSPGNLLRT